jgi:alkylation response protein AidB-like acyl-CoA dehydrogenase
MDFRENSEHKLLRGSLAKLAGDFGHRYYLEHARAHTPMNELWDALFASGFGAVNLPEEYGGGGQGIGELAIVVEELCASGCPVVLQIVSPGICGAVLATHGTEAQKQKWLPRLARGDAKMCFAITEPDAGSNSQKIATKATRDGDHWILNGSKYYTTGLDQADAVLVVAKTGTRPDGRSILSLFIVDPHAAGFVMSAIPMEIVEPERQFMLSFENVSVPADDLVGGAEGAGLRQMFAGLNPERITASAKATGLGRYFLSRAVSYANERQVWDVPIGAHQAVAHPLAAAKVKLELARLATTRAAWLADNGLDVGEAANMAKISSAEASLECFEAAIQTHGGNAYATEFGIAHLWGITRLARSAPVSREMALNHIAIHSLGLPRSY